jgi:hypothetical protein
MRTLIVLSALLASMSIFASFEDYFGREFTGDNAKTLCLQHLSTVEQNITRGGLIILESGCFPTYNKGQQIQIKYQRTAELSIESFTPTVDNPLTNPPKKNSSDIAQNLRDAGIVVVDSVPSYRNIRIDYIRTRMFHIANYTSPQEWASREECQEQMGQWWNTFKANGLFPLSAVCQARALDPDKFLLAIDYYSNMNTRLTALPGAQYDASESQDCQNNAQFMAALFKHLDFKILSAYCQLSADQKTAQSMVLHLGKLVNDQLGTYQGLAYPASPECLTNMEKIIAFLQGQNTPYIYGYCQQNQAAFIPVVYYYRNRPEVK